MPRSAANLPDDSKWSSEWNEARECLTEMGPDFAYEVEIIDSITASGVSDQLVFKTSMHDLWIAQAPVRPGPTEFIQIHAPSSLLRSQSGRVVIEHRSFGGNDDRIERPASEAVPLFWRFSAEKFGVVAVRSDSTK